jgi:hypothetical protein
MRPSLSCHSEYPNLSGTRKWWSPSLPFWMRASRP